MNQGASVTLPHDELMRRVIASLAGILADSNFGGAPGPKIVMQVRTGIDVEFPRSARALWLASSFDERKDINTVKGACIGVRSDPVMREGWELHYRFDAKHAGKLQFKSCRPREQLPQTAPRPSRHWFDQPSPKDPSSDVLED